MSVGTMERKRLTRRSRGASMVTAGGRGVTGMEEEEEEEREEGVEETRGMEGREGLELWLRRRNEPNLLRGC